MDSRIWRTWGNNCTQQQNFLKYLTAKSPRNECEFYSHNLFSLDDFYCKGECLLFKSFLWTFFNDENFTWIGPFLNIFLFRVVESVKDYTIKALINTVNHLGSIAFKVNNLVEEKFAEASQTGLQLTCLEQVPYLFTFFVQDKIVKNFLNLNLFLICGIILFLVI